MDVPVSAGSILGVIPYFASDDANLRFVGGGSLGLAGRSLTTCLHIQYDNLHFTRGGVDSVLQKIQIGHNAVHTFVVLYHLVTFREGCDPWHPG